jgi:ABC-type uncharacterized transport system involved in gliding motility auxiliary subunit
MLAPERRVTLISNACMVLGIVLLLVAFSVNQMTVGSTQLIATRTIAGLAAAAFIAAMAVAWRDIARWFRMRAAQEGLVSLAFMVAVWAIIVFAIYLGVRYHHAKDTTEKRIYSLSEKTVNVVKGLPRRVEIYAALKKPRPGAGGSQQEVNDLIRLYESLGGRVKVERLNPDRHFIKMRELGLDKETGDTILVRSQPPGGGTPKTQKLSTVDVSEQKLTSAIMNVSTEKRHKVYFLTGHGEFSIDETGDDGLSKLKKLLQDDMYDVATLNLATEEKIPDDAQVIVIDGAKSPLIPSQAEMIRRWADDGGRLLVMAANRLRYEEAPDLSDILGDWGIAVRADIVMDPGSKADTYGMVPVSVPSLMADHIVTRPWRKRATAFYFDPLTCSLRVDRTSPEQQPPGAPPPSGQPTELVRTSDHGFGKVNLKFTVLGQEPADTPGPLTLAACAEKDVPSATPTPDDEGGEKRKGKVFVIGDDAFALNQGLLTADGREFSRADNREFIRNAIHWLSEAEDLISIAPKDDQPQPLTLNKKQIAWNKLFCFLGPLLPLVIGVSIWFARRG